MARPATTIELLEYHIGESEKKAMILREQAEKHELQASELRQELTSYVAQAEELKSALAAMKR